MADTDFRGIFAIPPTPFNTDETLDTKGLDSVLNFTVDANDLALVRTNFGFTPPPAAAPEPASMALLGLGTAMMLRRR